MYFLHHQWGGGRDATGVSRADQMLTLVDETGGWMGGGESKSGECVAVGR